MTYSVAWTPAAEADLRRLDARVAERIAAKIEWLSENADTARIETLTGRWRGVCKLRVGNYRVLYTRDSAACTIVVHVVGHRRRIYRMGGTD